MNGEEETWEKLDAEFDHCVVDMKPHVLKLQHRSERQRCALWIKKLCEPSGAGTGIAGRKNRNLYARLLLHMLKRGLLEGPFTHKPEPGILKTLPSYMSIYFDEPNSPRVRSSSPECLPDWVMGELGNSESKHEELSKISSKEESSLATSLTYGLQILWWQSTVVARQETEFIQKYLIGRGKHRQMHRQEGRSDVVKDDVVEDSQATFFLK